MTASFTPTETHYLHSVVKDKKAALVAEFGIEYTDLVIIKNYPLQTYDGAIFFKHPPSSEIYAWVPDLPGSSVNTGRWRKEELRIK